MRRAAANSLSRKFPERHDDLDWKFAVVMAKRKAGGQPYGQSKSKVQEKQNTKLNISTYEDVADSEDEFHINRDKILLDEGPEAKRRRKWGEQGETLH